MRDLGISVHSIAVMEEGQDGAPMYNANSGEVILH
jgi:hypothetical protein